MCKNRSMIAFAFIATIMWGCTSGAMFEGFKNYVSKIFPSAAYLIGKKTETPQTIKPFASDEEKKQSFRTLKALEDWQPYMVDYDENYSISKAIQAIEKEQQRNNLIIFFQRLFINMVKDDIKNKEPYTVALGLKIEDDDSISMKYLPPNNDERKKEQELLWQLSQDPNDNDAFDKLKALLKERKNPTTSSTSLFPKIRLLPKKTKELGAEEWAAYLPTTDTMLIRKDEFTTASCTVLLHELTHRRQDLQARGKGGMAAVMPISNKLLTSTLPLLVLCEEEACKQGIDQHPDKGSLLKELWTSNNDIEFEKLELGHSFFYPYFSIPDKFVRTLKKLGLADTEPYKEIAKKVELDRKLTKQLASETYKLSQELASMLYPTYTNLALRSELEEFMAKVKVRSRQVQYGDIPNSLETEKILKGSKEFFDIKCKILKELDEEEKRTEKKSPFPMRFSMNFENKN